MQLLTAGHDSAHVRLSCSTTRNSQGSVTKAGQSQSNFNQGPQYWSVVNCFPQWRTGTCIVSTRALPSAYGTYSPRAAVWKQQQQHHHHQQQHQQQGPKSGARRRKAAAPDGQPAEQQVDMDGSTHNTTWTKVGGVTQCPSVSVTHTRVTCISPHTAPRPSALTHCQGLLCGATAKPSASSHTSNNSCELPLLELIPLKQQPLSAQLPNVIYL